MTVIKKWISKNRWSVSFAAAMLLVTALGVAASGCQVSDLITVDVPKDVKEAVDVEGDVTLTEIPDVWDDWQEYVRKNTERLESETERGYELLGFINSATDIAITAAEGAAPAFPGGAILIGLLGGAAGLFMKKPGTDREVAKEKEASYNAGMAKATEVAEIAAAVTGVELKQADEECMNCEGDCEFDCYEEPEDGTA